MNVGVYGVGFVGGATADVFEQAHKVYRYDAFYNPKRHKEPWNTPRHLENLAANSEVVFFCLPTPMQPNDEIDYTPMHESFQNFVRALEIVRRSRSDVIGVIRSTAVSGTTDNFAEQYKLRLTFNPEFLREKTALEDMRNTSRIVIGSRTLADGEIVEKVYRAVFPNAVYHHVSTREAEMVKYMANGMLAAQVALANEFFDICKAGGIDYNLVKSLVLEDSRIGRNLDVPGHDGDRGFGGKCFPKDLNALRAWARKHGFNPWLLDAVWRKNLEVREKHDWLEIPGAVSDNTKFE
ncbi:MAG: hypothetical protein AABY16_04280 [Nanoarchaeota archaeon]